MMKQGACQAKTLEISGGERSSFAICVGSDGKPFHDFVHNGCIFYILQTAGDLQVFAHGQFRISGWTLYHMTDLCPRSASIRTDSLPQHLDVSFARANHS